MREALEAIDALGDIIVELWIFEMPIVDWHLLLRIACDHLSMCI